MEIQNIPVSEIYADNSFNCRDNLKPIDVIDLAKSIRENGLIEPIIIRPITKDEAQAPEGTKYVIVAGYRRHLAFKVNEMPAIPAIVREGLSTKQAAIINLAENLMRKDLNIVEEAKSINKLRVIGMTISEIAKELGISPGWVQTRLSVLMLPTAIQEEAAKGVLTQYNIKQIASLSTETEQFEAVRRIKDAASKGKAKTAVNVAKKKNKMQAARSAVRNPREIQQLIDWLLKLLGPGLYTRVLAWANGNITNYQLIEDISLACKEKGKVFVTPENYDIPDDSINYHEMGREIVNS